MNTNSKKFAEHYFNKVKNENTMKFKNEAIQEFLEQTGRQDAINNVHDEHSDTFFYTDFALCTILDAMQNFSKLEFMFLDFETLKNDLEFLNQPLTEKDLQTLISYNDFLKNHLMILTNFSEDVLNFKDNFSKLKLKLKNQIENNKIILKDLI